MRIKIGTLRDAVTQSAGYCGGSRAARISAAKSPTSESTAAHGRLSAAAMRRTIAEPMIRPSATGASRRTCSGRLMPKPMQIGSGVCSAEPVDVVDHIGRQLAALSR